MQESVVYIAQYARITGVYCSIYKNQWCILLNIQESVVYFAQYTRLTGVYSVYFITVSPYTTGFISQSESEVSLHSKLRMHVQSGHYSSM